MNYLVLASVINCFYIQIHHIYVAHEIFKTWLNLFQSRPHISQQLYSYVNLSLNYLQAQSLNNFF